MDKLKECLTTRNSAKWARKGNHHIKILISSHGEEQKNLEGLLWGVKDREAHVNIYVGLRAQSKEKPLLGYGKNPPRLWEEPSSAMDVAEDKGSNLLLVVTLRVIPRNMKSTKIEKDNRENGNV